MNVVKVLFNALLDEVEKHPELVDQLVHEGVKALIAFLREFTAKSAAQPPVV